MHVLVSPLRKHRRSRLGRLLVLAILACVVVPAAAPAAGEFAQWLRDFRQEAAGQGISRATLDAAFAGVTPLARVIELDRRQPETTLTFSQYLQTIVTDERVRTGRQKLAENRRLTGRLRADFGVPASVLVALWAVESDYGRSTGGFKVIDALATLAFDGRRSAMFRAELIDALRILERGDITSERMIGSWAGAMGQIQFMPSTYLRYARDYDGGGRRDIWTDTADILASAGNYLSQLGWRPGLSWGRPVRLPATLDAGLGGGDDARPLSEWARLGVKAADGSALPQGTIAATLATPDGPTGPAFLVYENFHVLMRWNHSTYFALAVGILADRLGEADGLSSLSTY
jgi:membrane-bound lytic murein transglycosylase B